MSATTSPAEPATCDAFGHTWTRKPRRDAAAQERVMRHAVERSGWAREDRQLDLFTTVTVYRDTVHVHNGHRSAWMIVPSDPYPWWCGHYEPEATNA